MTFRGGGGGGRGGGGGSWSHYVSKRKLRGKYR